MRFATATAGRIVRLEAASLQVMGMMTDNMSLLRFYEKLQSLGLSDELLAYSRELVRETRKKSSDEVLVMLHDMQAGRRDRAVTPSASSDGTSDIRSDVFPLFLRLPHKAAAPPIFVMSLEVLTALGIAPDDALDITAGTSGIICRVVRTGGYTIRPCRPSDMDGLTSRICQWKIRRGRLHMTYLEPGQGRDAIAPGEIAIDILSHPHVVLEPRAPLEAAVPSMPEASAENSIGRAKQDHREDGETCVRKPATEAPPLRQVPSDAPRAPVPPPLSGSTPPCRPVRRPRPQDDDMHVMPKFSRSDLVPVSLSDVIGLLEKENVTVQAIGPNVFLLDGRTAGKADLVDVLNKRSKTTIAREYVLVTQKGA